MTLPWAREFDEVAAHDLELREHAAEGRAAGDVSPFDRARVQVRADVDAADITRASDQRLDGPERKIVAAADHDWHSAGVEQGSDRLGQPFVGGGGVLLQDFQVPGIRNQELVEVDARFHVEGAAEVLERSPDCRRPSGRSGAPAGLAHPLVERCAEQYGVGGLSPPRLDSMPQGGTIAGSYRENRSPDRLYAERGGPWQNPGRGVLRRYQVPPWNRAC